MIPITNKEFDDAIRDAFKAGENWGVTYSTWFTPKESETTAKQEEEIKRAREKLSSPNVIGHTRRAGKLVFRYGLLARRRMCRLVREANPPARPNDGNDRSTAHETQAHARERGGTPTSDGQEPPAGTQAHAGEENGA